MIGFIPVIHADCIFWKSLTTLPETADQRSAGDLVHLLTPASLFSAIRPKAEDERS
jgi:hypothetical protein